MTAPRFPLMGDPFALRGVDPRMAQFAQFAEDPAAAVVASGGGNSILFPRQPSAGILTPEDQAAIKRNTLLHVAAALLQSGGRSPNQQGTLANIGSALAGIDLPGATQSAMRMRLITQEMQDRARVRQAYEDIGRKYPAMPGENAEQRFTRLSNIASELVAVPGSDDLIASLSRIMAQLREQRGETTEVDVGDKVHLVDSRTGKIIATYPRGERPGSESSVLRLKAQAGAETAVEAIDEAERLLGQDSNADVLPVGAALARGAKTSGGLIGTLAGIAEPLAQQSMTENQQQFQAAIQRMVHSMVGLLPGSRQSIVLFNSLVNAYTPQPNESAQARSAKRAARLRARGWLDAIRRGEKIPIPPELGAAGITEGDIDVPSGAGGGAAPSRPSGAASPAAPVMPSSGPPAVPVNPRWWRNK